MVHGTRTYAYAYAYSCTAVQLYASTGCHASRAEQNSFCSAARARAADACASHVPACGVRLCGCRGGGAAVSIR
jgi:hypothetical protein